MSWLALIAGFKSALVRGHILLDDAQPALALHHRSCISEIVNIVQVSQARQAVYVRAQPCAAASESCRLAQLARQSGGYRRHFFQISL